VSAVTQNHPEPQERIAAAVLLAGRLEELGDELVGHFVAEARQGGISWTEIGRSMGVSKQAAQQRFVSRASSPRRPLDPSQGFSRFSPDARRVVVAAQQQAHESGNDVITVGHLVLALLADAHSPAAQAVAAHGVAVAELRQTASATLPPRAAQVRALIPFDPHVRAVLEQAFAEADDRGVELVGSEHVLLALLTLEYGTGVLAASGITPETVAAHLGG
jgi:hypothetical protein